MHNGLDVVAEIIMLEGLTCIYRSNVDLFFYVVGSGQENEVNMLVGLKYVWLVGWLCLTSHRQRGHLETAPPFTVPCEGHEAR